MSKAKYLLKNTILFSIGNFGSRILTFVLIPIYTIYLTKEEYGVVDLIQATVNLLIPVLSLGLSEATMRFAMDKNIDNTQVLSFSIRILLLGTIFLTTLTPLFYKIDIFSTYAFYFPLIYFFTTGKIILSQFCRGIEYIKLYVIDSLVTAISLLVLTIVFLTWIKLAANGFLLAWVISNGISCIFLLVSGKLYRYLTKFSISKEISKPMLNYGLPLVPNFISWWITGISGRYFVTMFCGLATSGIYSIAYRVPTIMSVFVEIFMQAWQLSAIKEYEGERDRTFYSEVYKFYSAITFLVGSGLILSTKFVAFLLFQNEFYIAWKYVPLLICAFTIGNLQTYLGTLYTAAKKTNKVFITSMSGALVNIILNIVLIPWLEVYGSIIATYISYTVVYVYRLVDSSKFLRIEIDLNRFIVSMLIITTQALLYTLEFNLSMLCNVAGFIAIITLHINEISNMFVSSYRYIKCVFDDVRS